MIAMPGLVPGIHEVLLLLKEDVDGRGKPGPPGSMPVRVYVKAVSAV
jgi:hypothetical protein